MSDRCSGNCCREFPLVGMGDTPEAIRTYLRDRAGPEGAQIADMVVPIRPIEPGTALPSGGICRTTPRGGGWMFTCRHFDQSTGDCGIYETRPRFMCRSYPYGSPCEHGDRCTWDAGRAGHWPVTFRRFDSFSVLTGVQRRTHLRVFQASGAITQETALMGQGTVDSRAKVAA